MPELAINDYEIDLVPVLRPDDFDGEVTRIDVDLWDRAARGRPTFNGTRRSIMVGADLTRAACFPVYTWQIIDP